MAQAVQVFNGAPCETNGVRLGVAQTNNVIGPGQSALTNFVQGVSNGSGLFLFWSANSNGSQHRFTLRNSTGTSSGNIWDARVDGYLISQFNIGFPLTCVTHAGLLIDTSPAPIQGYVADNTSFYTQIYGNHGQMYNYWIGGRNDIPCGPAPLGYCMNGALYYGNTLYQANKP